MTGSLGDAYALLGVPQDAGEADVRAAYRRLAQLHHPDHNGGSPLAAHRFAELQVAYARVLAARRLDSGPGRAEIDARLAELERGLAAERREREAAAARAGARVPPPAPATPEELGYVTTDDSLTDIVTDLLRRLRHDGA